MIPGAARPPRRHLWALVLGLVLFPAPSFALILLSFQSIPGSLPILGAGTPIGILNYGTVSAFGPVGNGVTRSVGASAYTISTRIGVRVTKLLTASSTYTLRARVVTSNGVGWEVDGSTLTTGATTVATLQPYATTVPHTLSLVVPFARPAAAVTTVLEVTAIAD